MNPSTKAKILFATVPMDGHFYPLTALAVHLKKQGYDVRWYTGSIYQEKLNKLEIPYLPFRKAREINAFNLEEIFPERKKYKSIISKLKFDIKHVFVKRAPEYFEDIKAMYQEFPFDLVIGDAGFTGLPLIRRMLHKPVIAVSVVPLMETSRNLPPYGMGLTPADNFTGKLRQRLSRFLSKHIIFKEATVEINKIFRSYGLPTTSEVIFDLVIRESDLVLQSGAPGFEYKRRDMSDNIRFIGSLLPYQEKKQVVFFEHLYKLKQYHKVILVTQGTVEKDPEKIIVPTLEAFKNSPYLVIVTTGGSQTQALRARYPQNNVIIEDFIDFNYIMPYTDVYVTNGGYGGVLLGIEHKLPMVVAGIHEGKCEITARVGYFKLGINLKTETPTPQQIAKSVEEVMDDVSYKKNVAQFKEELSQYNPAALCEQYVLELLGKQNTASATKAIENTQELELS